MSRRPALRTGWHWAMISRSGRCLGHRAPGRCFLTQYSSTAPPDIPAFIQLFKLPLKTPLIKTAPKRRLSWRDMSVAPRRSDRLAGKSPMRHPKPQVQAKRVMLNKWKPTAEQKRAQTPDDGIVHKFHQAFAEPVSSTKWAAMRELFPGNADFAAEESA